MGIKNSKTNEFKLIEFIVGGYKTAGNKGVGFALVDDINDIDYVFTHKLKKLILYCNKMIESNIKIHIKYRIKLDPVSDNENNTMWKFRAFLLNSCKTINFYLDIAQIIGTVCHDHGRYLNVIISDPLKHGSILHMLHDHRYSGGVFDTNLESQYEKILNHFNYIKVIPFNINICLQNNIRMPHIIKWLIEKCGKDIAEEIAKYLYIICIKGKDYIC